MQVFTHYRYQPQYRGIYSTETSLHTTTATSLNTELSALPKLVCSHVRQTSATHQSTVLQDVPQTTAAHHRAKLEGISDYRKLPKYS
jgi:hypothetical protein